jgi:hypothetical protein
MPPRKELNVVMDNCGGQNKNRFVLRLAPLFVELLYYKQVNIIFLVAGHTKNAADRLFNLLKVQYRKSQCFTMTQLNTVLNQNEYVESIKVNSEDFVDFGKLEDSLYKQTPLSGNTKKYQLFSSSDQEMGVLYGRETASSTEEHRMDLRKGTEQERQNILDSYDLEDMDVLTTDGIKTIKQVELYAKWRKHVPEEYKSPLYDHPGDDVLQAVRDDRKSKKEYIQARRLNQQPVEETGKLAAKKSPEKKQPSKRKAPPKKAPAAKQTSTKAIAKKGGTNKPKTTSKRQK